MLWVLNWVIHRRGKIQTRGARLEVRTVVTGKGAGCCILCRVEGYKLVGIRSNMLPPSSKLRDGDLHRIDVDLFKLLNILSILMVWNDLVGSI